MLKIEAKLYIILLFTVMVFNNCTTTTTQQNNVDNVKANKLLGIWAYDTSENATFEIRKDSIYYVDDNRTYKYDLMGDSIIIRYDDFISTGKIDFVGDTLIISDESGKSKYWHF